MFFGDEVQDTRQLFFSSWRKYRQKQALLPLEQQLVDVILAHPEYHELLDKENHPDIVYFPQMGETNPFLHMGLHIAIREQIATNRPSPITSIYQQLMTKYQNTLVVEHMMMECLAECLWQAQRNQSAPDEITYVDRLTRL